MNLLKRKTLAANFLDLSLTFFGATFIFVVLGISSLSYFNLKKGTEALGSDIRIDIILSPSTTDASQNEETSNSKAQLLEYLGSNTWVQKVEELSVDKVWKDFLDSVKVSAKELDPDGTIPEILEVQLKPENLVSKAQMQNWISTLKNFPAVASVQGGFDWLGPYLSFFSFLEISGGLIVLGFWILGFILITLVYSYSVLRQKEQIEVQALIGATPTFILKPILAESFLMGILIGGVSSLLTYFLFRFAFVNYAPIVSEIIPLPTQMQGGPLIIAILLSSSILMSLVGSCLGFWRAQADLRKQEFSI